MTTTARHRARLAQQNGQGDLFPPPPLGNRHAEAQQLAAEIPGVAVAQPIAAGGRQMAETSLETYRQKFAALSEDCRFVFDWLCRAGERGGTIHELCGVAYRRRDGRRKVFMSHDSGRFTDLVNAGLVIRPAGLRRNKAAVNVVPPHIREATKA